MELQIPVATVVAQLKRRINRINETLQGKQLYVYESGTQYIVVTLVDMTDHSTLAVFGFDALSARDRYIVRALLSLIENKYPQKMAVAA